MKCDICPWWLGYLLVNPLRRRLQDPVAILGPHVRDGMTVIEPGPGMGFFTLDLARLVGPHGRVVCVDVQQKMLDALRKRAGKIGMQDRIETRLARDGGLGIDDLSGLADFVMAFAVVHEVPDGARFFREAYAALKPGGRMMLSEPAHHVSDEAFAATLAHAEHAGFRVEERSASRAGRTALLEKPKPSQDAS